MNTSSNIVMPSISPSRRSSAAGEAAAPYATAITPASRSPRDQPRRKRPEPSPAQRALGLLVKAPNTGLPKHALIGYLHASFANGSGYLRMADVPADRRFEVEVGVVRVGLLLHGGAARGKLRVAGEGDQAR